MANTELISQSIRNRKPIINHKANIRLKELQQQMVKLSFSGDIISEEYKTLIKEVKLLRKSISQ